jgi:hypothetical protein
MKPPAPFHVRAWLQSPQIQEWIAESRSKLAEVITENLPKLIEKYDPQSNRDWFVNFSLPDQYQRAIGINRHQWLLWTGTGISIRECDYSLQQFLDSLPIPTKEDLRKAELLGSYGLSLSQAYEVLECRPNADLENLIAIGAEQCSQKSDFRRATEDNHLPSIQKILRRFGWREAG